MTKTVITLFLALLALAISPAVSHAQAPDAQGASTRMMRFAGVLTDASGGPLSGPHTVTFTLYDTEEGGTALWTETLTVTADERGRYAAYLGFTAALPQEAFTTEQARWVGTSVEGRDLARTALVAAPYALKAADADSLGGKAASSFVTTNKDGKLERADGTAVDSAAVDGSGVAGQIAKWVDGATLSSSVISETASNRVGFGLTDPTGGGVVDSVFTIRNFDNNTGFAILNASQQRRFAINTLATGGWQLFDGGSSIWNAGLMQLGGRLGLGTVSPAAKFDIVISDSGDGVRATGSGLAVHGIATSTSGAGVVGDNATGEAVVGRVGSASIDGIGAVVGRNDGLGYGVRGFTTKTSGTPIGVLGQAGISSGVGQAGRFENLNSGNADNALEAATNGTGATFVANHTGASGNIAIFQSASATVARIDKTGKGFFNGGIQAFGADLAEAFDVDGDFSAYEPGDVLEISTDQDRRLRKSTEAYSTRVLGVFATKPGVLLSDLSTDADHSRRVPLGVVGVIPTKVSGENGAIRRGDLLVASATRGHAMKAGPNPPAGSIIGKALADFAAPGTGVIDVFVNVR